MRPLGQTPPFARPTFCYDHGAHLTRREGRMSTSNEPAKRTPRGIALGFVVAFALSTATIIYTGLKVGAPQRESRDSSASAAPQESRAADGAEIAVGADEPSPSAESSPDPGPGTDPATSQ